MDYITYHLIDQSIHNYCLLHPNPLAKYNQDKLSFSQFQIVKSVKMTEKAAILFAENKGLQRSMSNVIIAKDY